MEQATPVLHNLFERQPNIEYPIYNAQDEHFLTFIERFELFIKTNRIPNCDCRLPLLLICLGKHSHDAIYNMTFPLKPEDWSYEDNCQNLLNFYNYFIKMPDLDYSPLQTAVLNGDMKVLKSFLENDNDISKSIGFYNTSLLHIAAQYGKLEIVKILIEAEATVDAKTTEMVTPLHLASQFGFLEVVETLIQANANVNAQNFAKISPLHLAAANNKLNVVKCLLNAGANIDAKSRENEMALHIASHYGFADIVKLLIEHEAKINVSQKDSFTPLHLSLQQKHSEVSEILIKNGADVNAKDNQQWTPLHNAVTNGNSLKLIQMIIEKGANINAKIDNGRSALHMAAEYDRFEILKFLIEKGADVNALDKRNWTPLHNAAYDGNFDIAKHLVDNNAKKSAKTIKKTTPLHFATNYEHLNIVKLLVERGADINAQDNTDWTPLHFAASIGNVEIINFLAEHGADPNMRDDQKSTSLDIAIVNGQPEGVKALIAHNANVNAQIDRNVTSLFLAIQMNKSAIVKTLLMNGAYFDYKRILPSKICITPLDFAIMHKVNKNIIVMLKTAEMLFDAVERNNINVVKKYTLSRTFVNLVSSTRLTLLNVAVNNGNIDLVNILLTNGADVKLTNGSTVLHTACSKGATEIVETLLKHTNHEELGDFINAQCAGKTSLHISAQLGHFNIVKILLSHGAIYNKINGNGKRPIDLTQNKNITEILELVDEMFQKCNEDIVNKLKTLESTELKAILCARNEQNKTLLAHAASFNKDIAKELLQFLKTNEENVNDCAAMVKNLNI